MIKFGKKQIKEDLQLRHLTKNVSELRDLFTFAPYLCLRVHTNVRTGSDKKEGIIKLRNKSGALKLSNDLLASYFHCSRATK